MNFPSVDVRVIGVDDWRLWRDVRREALREAPHAFGSTLADWQGESDTEMRWRARLSSVPFNVVAYVDGEAAGMVSGTAPDQDGTSELISMWVAPFARGRGVGDSLVAAVVQWARGQRAVKVALPVFERNEHAQVLYRRHGFVDAGTIASTEDGAAERQMVLDLRT
jgi:GNAT superfamily N-acetyltransferase